MKRMMRWNRLLAVLLAVLMVVLVSGAVWADPESVEGTDPVGGEPGVQQLEGGTPVNTDNNPNSGSVDEGTSGNTNENNGGTTGGNGLVVENTGSGNVDANGNGNGNGVTGGNEIIDGTPTTPTTPTTPATPGSDNQQKPVEQQPVEQKPVEQQPVEQKPVEQQPAEQKPMEQQPAEQLLVEQKPADQKGTEQVLQQDPNTVKEEEKKEEEKKEEEKEELENFSLEETFVDSVEGIPEYVGMDSTTLLSGFMEVGPQSDAPGMETEQMPMLFASSYNGNKLVDLTSKVYDALKSMVINVASGNINSTTMETAFSKDQLSGHVWTEASLGMSLFGDESHTTINRTAAEAAINQIYDASYAVKSLIRDCPFEMFWFGNQYSMARTYTPSISYDKNRQEYVMTLNAVSVKIDMQVAGDYRGGSNYTTDKAKIASISGAMANARNIINAASGMGDMDKLDYFRQQICNLVSYNTNTDAGGYGNPWQLIYVFDQNASTNVVCEGYAKAFQYLCDESHFSTGDFAVYSVAGTFQTGSSGSGTGHLWNIVHMNGRNYLVDLTNCDGASPHTNLFMVQALSGSVNDGYVFQSGSSKYTYKYYEDTRKIYSDFELEMIPGQVVQPSPGTPQTPAQPVHTHTPEVTIQAVSPTLFHTGRTEEKRCSGCRQVLSASQTIPVQELSRPLVLGCQGDDVRQVQQALISLGYFVNVVDGDFGRITDAAVRQFQREHGLYVDGEVGNKTLAEMRRQGGSNISGSSSSSSSSGNGGSTPAPAPVAALTRDLYLGVQGSDVSQMQQMLKSLGYDIYVDGDFGPKTDAIVRQFQASHGLYVDGLVGQKTFAKLVSLTGGNVSGGGTSGGSGGSGTLTYTRDLFVGSQGEDVRALQQKLKSLGYSIYVDGDFGVKTMAVVQAYQAAHGLYVDGLVGRKTIADLNRR